MKILVVNGYSSTKEGKEMFNNFLQAIYSAFDGIKKALNDQLEFHIKDRRNIDNYLYELNSPYLQNESAIHFDLIDLVLLAGDANLKPWSEMAEKMMVLLRMCRRTRKKLFTSSFGFQAIIFLTATNFERSYNVVNGQSNGTSLKRFSAEVDPKTLSGHDICIDNITGDIFSFNKNTGEWIPKGNCGLHYNYATQGNKMEVGKFVLNTPKYTPKSQYNGVSWVNNHYEIICTLKKEKLALKLLKGVSHQFKVPKMNQWDAHPFTCINPEKKISVLGEGDRGPLIIEGGEMVAVQFNIDNKYLQTVTILKNFILSAAEVYQAGNLKSLNVQSSILLMAQENNSYQQTRNKHLKIMQSKELRRDGNKKEDAIMFKGDSNLEEREIIEFRHVGLSANHKHNKYMFVENNSITTTKIKSNLHHSTNKTKEKEEEGVKNEKVKQSSIGRSKTEESKLPIEKQGAEKLPKQNRCFSQAEVRRILHPTIPLKYLNSCFAASLEQKRIQKLLLGETEIGITENSSPLSPISKRTQSHSPFFKEKQSPSTKKQNLFESKAKKYLNQVSPEDSQHSEISPTMSPRRATIHENRILKDFNPADSMRRRVTVSGIDFKNMISLQKDQILIPNLKRVPGQGINIETIYNMSMLDSNLLLKPKKAPIQVHSIDCAQNPQEKTFLRSFYRKKLSNSNHSQSKSIVDTNFSSRESESFQVSSSLCEYKTYEDICKNHQKVQDQKIIGQRWHVTTSVNGSLNGSLANIQSCSNGNSILKKKQSSDSGYGVNNFEINEIASTEQSEWKELDSAERRVTKQKKRLLTLFGKKKDQSPTHDSKEEGAHNVQLSRTRIETRKMWNEQQKDKKEK